MLPLIVIRPEPGCTTTVSAARAAGLDPHGFPLFAVIAKGWQAPPAEQFDALLLGSANAVRAAGPGLATLRHLPAYCVGEATAQAARDAGLTVAATGRGGLQGALTLIAPPHRRLLRLAGEERVPLTLPDSVTMTERVVYASRAQPMPPDLAALLSRPALIALHSGEAAHHLAAECVRLGLRRALHSLCVLAPRVAGAAGPGWREVAVAGEPSDAALLALARQMCQEP